MRESRQTKEGKREGEKEKKKGEIEKKTVVAAEGPKVSVIQSVSCCDTALRFCKIVFLHIFYLFSYYCVNLYLTDFKDSLVIKKITILCLICPKCLPRLVCFLGFYT